jgi:hypothetical protein
MELRLETVERLRVRQDLVRRSCCGRTMREHGGGDEYGDNDANGETPFSQ